MNWINARLTALSDLLLAPFAGWPPQVVLLGVSIVAGVAMAFVFRHTSNQAGLRAVADRTRAHLLCLRLFRDNAGVALRCQWELLKAIGLRLWYSLGPLAVLGVPFVLILSQIALRFEHRPLKAGESVVVALHLSSEGAVGRDDVILEVPPGVRVETPPLRAQADRAVYWRLRVDSPGAEPLRWRIGDEVVQMRIVGQAGAERLCAISARRPGHHFFDRLLNPGEPGLDAGSAVRAVEVHYPGRSTPIFGYDLPWWASFLIGSILAALVARPLLKVQF